MTKQKTTTVTIRAVYVEGEGDAETIAMLIGAAFGRIATVSTETLPQVPEPKPRALPRRKR